jgi:alkylation response protein AidB-like acyl-CoA dehydrogenase
VDFRLDPPLRDLQAQARAFVDEVLVPLEPTCDLGDGLPAETERKARERALRSGFFAPNMPREWGGAGLDVLEQVILEEQLGRATNCLWALVWRPANVLVYATPGQRERYVRPYIGGEFRGAYAITEPGAGSDTTRLATEARRDGDGFAISGEKWFATGGDVARFFMVVADVVDGGRRLPTIFLVDRDAPGFHVGRRPRFTHAVVYGHPELRLEAVRVGADRVLGGVGQGMALTREWFREERLMIAARCLGAAERALELAQAWALERQAFGQPIGTYQGIQWMLADSACELAAARALTYKAAWEMREGLDPKEAHAKASMVKLFASEMAGRVTDRAVQILGGRGYMRDHPVERLWRDTRVDRIWEGTSEIQRLIIARGLQKRGVATLTR